MYTDIRRIAIFVAHQAKDLTTFNRAIILVALFVATFPQVMHGQSLTEEPEITRMMDAFVDYNQRNQEVAGYRVEILVTTDRRQMERVRSDFKVIYPDYDLHFTHDNPFYHLTTGAFTSQYAARPFLKMLKEKYPDAFIVSDQIVLEEVFKYL